VRGADQVLSWGFSQVVSKSVSLTYLLFLTVLLVVRNPLEWFGHQDLIVSAFQLIGFIVHFVTFAILAIVMLAARWPLKNTVLIGLLAVYAASTELIQGPIPNRSPEWVDFLQDLAGLAAGAALWWAFVRWREPIGEVVGVSGSETGVG
jgi:VanZ family protein